MTTIPKNKIVKRTAKYDDLLDKSPLTRAMLNKKEQSTRKKLFKEKQKEKRTPSSPLRVHLRDRKSADAFAKLIQQQLNHNVKTIRFAASYDAKKKQVHVASKLFRNKWGFVEEKTERKKLIKNRKTWNTDDFFNRHWIDMPPFENEQNAPFCTFKVEFKAITHKAAFAELIKQRLTPETKSIWFPFVKHKTTGNLVWIGDTATNRPRYPVFIVSKGRAQYGPLTAKTLRDIGVPFYLMVEPHEYDKYKVLCEWAVDIFCLPKSNHGMGPGYARNACWDVAKKILKSKRHWVLDDNLRDFYRLHDNDRIRVGDGTIFRAAEDFVDRYTNIPVAGFGYKFFHAPNEKQYPFKVNTRIYSCLLIDNECPYRWRGRYNEDTILSLDVMKDGHETHHDLNKKNTDGSFKVSKRERLSTVEFVAFTQDKLATQTMKGGNTAEFYDKEGTAAKSAMLVDAHPDVSEAVIRFNREHHDVAYEVFRTNWLIRTDKRKKELKRRGWKPSNNKNPYGMRLVKR